MTWLKRIGFLALVNIAIVVMMSLVLNLLGVQPYLSGKGIDYQSLVIFCLVWGMGGSFISLLMSKWLAKRLYGLQIVQPGSQFDNLLNMVERIAKINNLPKTPEVGVYHSEEINAFATGPSRSNCLVAVSTGLLNKMDRSEQEGVIGHEVAHIANGDMVTMTLLQGVLNAFVMFLARIVAMVIDNALSGDRREGRGLGFLGYGLTVFVLEIAFGLGAQMITAYFSRHREFRADAGSAKTVGREKMVRALQALKRDYPVANEQTNTPLAAFQISSKESFMALFSTHPSLERRIAALQKFAY